MNVKRKRCFKKGLRLFFITIAKIYSFASFAYAVDLTNLIDVKTNAVIVKTVETVETDSTSQASSYNLTQKIVYSVFGERAGAFIPATLSLINAQRPTEARVTLSLDDNPLVFTVTNKKNNYFLSLTMEERTNAVNRIYNEDLGEKPLVNNALRKFNLEITITGNDGKKHSIDNFGILYVCSFGSFIVSDPYRCFKL